MNVVHIIPAAFEYFDDIKQVVFGIVEKLNCHGVESSVITLQYGPPNRTDREQVSGIGKQGTGGVAPSYEYGGTQDISQAIFGLSDFDLVHLHCPFLGAAGKIYRWKKANPNTPLLATYYRPVQVVDLISFFISIYNSYHLPKIFSLVDALAVFGLTYKNRRFPLVDPKRVVYIDADLESHKNRARDLTNHIDQVKLKSEQIETIAANLGGLYSLMLKK